MKNYLKLVPLACSAWLFSCHAEVLPLQNSTALANAPNVKMASTTSLGSNVEGLLRYAREHNPQPRRSAL